MPRAPGSLSSRLIVSFITGSGQRSTLVMTTKSGTLSAIAMPMLRVMRHAVVGAQTTIT